MTCIFFFQIYLPRFRDSELAKLALLLAWVHPYTAHMNINLVLVAFTFILCDLTRCMFSAGVLGRILPHPSTVQRMFVLTSLVSSMMVGFIISRDCDRDSS